MSAINWTPGPLNSILIKTENAVPNNPENRAKIKYNDPISLAFVDRNHRSVQIDMDDTKFLLLLLIFELYKLSIFIMAIHIINYIFFVIKKIFPSI